MDDFDEAMMAELYSPENYGAAANGLDADEAAEEFEWATDAQEAHQGDDGYDEGEE